MSRLRDVNRYARPGALRRGRSAIPRRWLTVFLAIAILIALVKTITVITGRTNPVDRAINIAATPLVMVARYTADGFASLGHIFRLPTLLKENARLRGENSELRRLLSETELVRTNNANLRRALELKKAQFSAVNAVVIARPFDLWLDQVILDAGSKDGVVPGNLVVNADGVVGVIDERVEDDRCWVTLVTSPRFRLAAVSTGGVEGVIRGLDSRAMTLEGIRGKPDGNDDGNLELMHVKAGSDVKVGEKVFSAGVSTGDSVASRRPRGQLVGTVIHKSVDPNGGLDVRVEPAVNPNRINVVAVITQ